MDFCGFHKYTKDKYVQLEKMKVHERVGTWKKIEYFWINKTKHSKTRRYKVIYKTHQNTWMMF